MSPVNELLQSLPADAVALIRSDLRSIELRQNTILHETDQIAESVIFPISATISLVLPTLDESMIEVAAIGCDGAVGLSFGGPSDRTISRAVVQIGGKALAVSHRTFQAAASRHPDLGRLAAWAARIMVLHVQQNVACHALHPVDRRVARWLLHAQQRSGRDELPITQETLSRLLGVQRTTISTILQGLQNKKFVQIRRGSIAITDAYGLQSNACECFQTLSIKAHNAAA